MLGCFAVLVVGLVFLGDLGFLVVVLDLVCFVAVGVVLGWICLVLASFVCGCLLILLCVFDLVWFVPWVAFPVYLFCCCSFLIVLVVVDLSYWGGYCCVWSVCLRVVV